MCVYNLYDLCQTFRMPKFYAATTVGGNQQLESAVFCGLHKKDMPQDVTA